jgi:hypothetical protein
MKLLAIIILLIPMVAYSQKSNPSFTGREACIKFHNLHDTGVVYYDPLKHSYPVYVLEPTSSHFLIIVRKEEENGSVSYSLSEIPGLNKNKQQ